MKPITPQDAQAMIETDLTGWLDYPDLPDEEEIYRLEEDNNAK